MIQVYSLEHALFEDPVFISRWLDEHQVSHHTIKLHKGDLLPDPAVVDLLIIMGGPMNIYEEEIYPWLIEEKAFIRRVIDLEKPVLGICLGGQLISSVLGGIITRSSVPEYGWHTVYKVAEISPIVSKQGETAKSEIFPDTLTVFQWHQDTFQIPPGAVHLYSAETCNNQAFMYNSHVIGLQFHPEMDEATIRGFLTQARTELEEKGLLFLQDEITSQIDLCSRGHQFISGVMPYLIGQVFDNKWDRTPCLSSFFR
ncbi:MAG: type 1 glutamine amidotransferase [Methanobacteriota archaeon]